MDSVNKSILLIVWSWTQSEQTYWNVHSGCTTKQNIKRLVICHCYSSWYFTYLLKTKQTSHYTISVSCSVDQPFRCTRLGPWQCVSIQMGKKTRNAQLEPCNNIFIQSHIYVFQCLMGNEDQDWSICGWNRTQEPSPLFWHSRLWMNEPSVSSVCDITLQFFQEVHVSFKLVIIPLTFNDTL